MVMLRCRLVRGILAFAALVAATPSWAAGSVSVFQDPTNTGTPGAPPVNVSAGGPSVSLNLFYQQIGGNASAAGTVCLSGEGDEICGWDIYVGASAPTMVLQSFTPNPGSDIVANISGNVLRANGGDPINGEIGIHRLGTLVVSTSAAGPTLTVSGNLSVTAKLASTNVATGNILAQGVSGGDSDGDGVVDGSDNCPTVPNGLNEAGVPNVGNQVDGDGDGVGDACDNCRTVANARVVGGAAAFVAANPWATLTGDQRDDDHDGYGNKCDGKFPGVAGLFVSNGDLIEWRTANTKNRTLDQCGTAGTHPCAIYDLDETGLFISNGDLIQWRTLNTKAPGPKCPSCPLACVSGSAGTCGAIP